jgi:hypothetical protein
MTALKTLVSLGLLAFASATQAAPIAGKGTWESTLKARDVNGHAVALDSADAAFFYDSTLDVTWLADMNASGTLAWGDALAWADALTVGGFDDWRLPSIIDSGAAGCDLNFDGGTDCGYNTQTQVAGQYSEWAHLYYVTLGNLGFCAPGGNTPDTCEGPQPGWGLSNTAHFQDMQAAIHWSATDYTAQGGTAWVFYAADGYQSRAGKGVALNAVALRTGDVLRDVGTVPEPQGLALALTALAGLGAALRRRRAA